MMTMLVSEYTFQGTKPRMFCTQVEKKPTGPAATT